MSLRRLLRRNQLKKQQRNVRYKKVLRVTLVQEWTFSSSINMISVPFDFVRNLKHVRDAYFV